MSTGIQGKVIVITGASSGIGAHLAKHLFQKGANIVLAARRLEELQKVSNDITDDDSRILIHRCDVSKRADHESLRDRAIEKFGKIDTWINNAGVALSKTALELTGDDVDLMISVNTKSVLYGMQTIVPYYKERREGQVINISSMLGRAPFASFRAAYSASKAAMNSLTCNVRVDLQNEGFNKIFIALFTPGVVATEFGNNAIGGGPDSKQIPGAQPVEEVVDLLVEMVDHPDASVDVYSRLPYRGMISAYYSAEDIRTIESKPPFTPHSFSATGNTSARDHK